MNALPEEIIIRNRPIVTLTCNQQNFNQHLWLQMSLMLVSAITSTSDETESLWIHEQGQGLKSAATIKVSHQLDIWIRAVQICSESLLQGFDDAVITFIRQEKYL